MFLKTETAKSNALPVVARSRPCLWPVVADGRIAWISFPSRLDEVPYPANITRVVDDRGDDTDEMQSGIGSTCTATSHDHLCAGLRLARAARATTGTLLS